MDKVICMLMERLIQETLHKVFADPDLSFDKTRFAGGLTNYNYIMDIKGIEYVIRQPGGMTNLMIDRRIERINSGIASELGLNSECIYFDEDSGIKISLYIANSRNFALADPSDKQNLESVAELMKRTHTSVKTFPNRFDWEKELGKYERLIAELRGELFFDHDDLKEQLLRFGEPLRANMRILPCHNDTVPENFILDADGKAYLIDWEYAGMNDPAWDVAAYILESRLDGPAVACLLRNYYGDVVEKDELKRIQYFMLAQDLLWTAWALIRHYNGEDFLDYCNLRYERLRRNIRVLDRNSLTIESLVGMVKN